MAVMRGFQPVIVIYDIPNDRLRQKVSEICLDYGLDRVQYSAFQGQMKRSHQKELMSKIRSLLGRAPGKVQLIPLSEEMWKRRLEVIHE